MAFVEAAKKYQICKCRREPREMISHVDALAKVAYKSDVLDLEEILECSSRQFWGLPVVRFMQNRNNTIDRLTPNPGGLVNRTIKHADNYYLSVEVQKLKSDVLEGLLNSLVPDNLVVLVASDESAYRVMLKLGSYSVSSWQGGSLIQAATKEDNPRQAMIVTNPTMIPLLSASKTLLIIYDELPSQFKYSPAQDMSRVMPVSIVGPGEAIPASADKVEPFLFGYFLSSGT